MNGNSIEATEVPVNTPGSVTLLTPNLPLLKWSGPSLKKDFVALLLYTRYYLILSSPQPYEIVSPHVIYLATENTELKGLLVSPGLVSGNTDTGSYDLKFWLFTVHSAEPLA